MGEAEEAIAEFKRSPPLAADQRRERPLTRCLVSLPHVSVQNALKQVAADEIYVKAPVLMVVEQASLCWVSGQLSDAVTGAAWAKEFAQLPNLEQLARDGGRSALRPRSVSCRL